MIRFGYSFWGFLGDRKLENGQIVSTPDGNAAYSWSILWEAQRRGWETWLLQRDRDAELVSSIGYESFDSFSTSDRYSAYLNTKKTITIGDVELVTLDDLPDFDIVLIEWRWPIEGRNHGLLADDPNYQPDLDRQLQLLRHFKERGTKIVVWDLDHKLTTRDEEEWDFDAIFETSVIPRRLTMDRIRVEPPIVIDSIMQMPTLECLPQRKLVYVGSRYERDDVIDEWIKPVSDDLPFQVEFWGNWTREQTLVECRQRWPNVLYNGRITMSDFRRVYGTAVACPLLGKRSYMEHGFVTPRVWEALMFGTLPIGLASHMGIDDYVLIVAADARDLTDIVTEMSYLTCDERDVLRRENVEKIRFMDVANFVDRLQETL